MFRKFLDTYGIHVLWGVGSFLLKYGETLLGIVILILNGAFTVWKWRQRIKQQKQNTDMGRINKDLLSYDEQATFKKEWNYVRQALLILRNAQLNDIDKNNVSHTLSSGNDLMLALGGRPLQHGEKLTDRIADDKKQNAPKQDDAPVLTVKQAKAIIADHEEAQGDHADALKEATDAANRVAEAKEAHDEKPSRNTAADLFDAQQAHAKAKSKLQDATENLEEAAKMLPHAEAKLSL